MIPASFIQEWSNQVPWPYSRQVEQDLIITRALCDLSNSPALEGKPVSRAVAEQRMLKKLNRSLTEDIALLLPADIRFNNDDAITAFNHVWTELITRIKGEPWKLSEQLINELRNGKLPKLLQR